jgi:hypothetical protein
MSPWLVTWKAMSERTERTIKNRIAAILPNRIGTKEIKRTLQLIYANYLACSGLSDRIYISDQLRYAKYDCPYKATHIIYPQITCGADPYLRARHAFDLTIEEDEDGYEVVRWEENVYPALDPKRETGEQIEEHLPFKRRRMMYSTRTNAITRQDDPPG